ncbi:MAG: helix-turn-helix domain-containing protein [Sporolactobacillus sp.]
MDTKQAIFDCALSLFSKRGYNGVSMRDIAEAVGIKGSSIYNHYKGKQAIMDDICRVFTDTLSYSRPPLAEVRAWLPKMTPGEVFKTFIRAYGERITEQWTQMARLVFSEQFYNEEAGRIFRHELIAGNNHFYVAVLTLMEERQMIACHDKPLVAELVNNEQMLLTMRYAHCQTSDERHEIAKLMMASADYLLSQITSTR